MKPKEINILVGRFQPFTLGHLKCVERIYKTHGLKTILCCIKTDKIDDRHPFLTSILWGTMKKMVKRREELEDIILVRSADLVRIGEEVGSRGYKIKTWTCGTDRFADYERMCKKYAPEVECVEVGRREDDVSATMVRQSLKAHNEDRYKELVPEEFYPLYEKLSSIMQEVE